MTADLGGAATPGSGEDGGEPGEDVSSGLVSIAGVPKKGLPLVRTGLGERGRVNRGGKSEWDGR